MSDSLQDVKDRKALEDFEQEFVAVLTQAERLAGQDEGQVVIVSIPDWGFTPFGTRWR